VVVEEQEQRAPALLARRGWGYEGNDQDVTIQRIVGVRAASYRETTRGSKLQQGPVQAPLGAGSRTVRSLKTATPAERVTRMLAMGAALEPCDRCAARLPAPTVGVATGRHRRVGAREALG